MRVTILGNSGSGKSTLARRLCEHTGAALLELDSIVWEPGKIAVLRPRRDIEVDLGAFLASHPSWVIEGCYGELAQQTLALRPLLLFLNPGEQVCVENNQRRPWEPHKYASAEAQAAMLEPLLSWVRGYYTRDDAWSLKTHQAVFQGYPGPRQEWTHPWTAQDLSNVLPSGGAPT